MKAVVLAAGEGSRLRPLTERTPKPLIEIDSQPLLSYVLDVVVELAPDEIVLVIGYLGEEIVVQVGDSYRGVPVTYARQPSQNGLARAVLAAEPEINQSFIVAYGDAIHQADLDACLAHHGSTGAAVTMLAKEVPASRAAQTGVVETDATGSVANVVEKPHDSSSTLALPGLFVFEPVIFRACELVRPSERGEYELLDAIDLLRYAGYRLEVCESGGRHINVNTQDDIERAEDLYGQ